MGIAYIAMLIYNGTPNSNHVVGFGITMEVDKTHYSWHKCIITWAQYSTFESTGNNTDS